VSPALAFEAMMCPADDAQLFEQHALGLQAVVSRRVRTSPVNVEDACGFAWLQLIRRRPPGHVAFAWLCTTAIREAMRLHRRGARTVCLEQIAEASADARYGVDGQLELMCAGEEIRQARLRPREARLIGLRAAGYSRKQVAELTGDTYRTVDRQLARAQRKLRVARRADAEVR
jgi:DNA-directed RNA polymerase specialized sigma24 family protein